MKDIIFMLYRNIIIVDDYFKTLTFSEQIFQHKFFLFASNIMTWNKSYDKNISVWMTDEVRRVFKFRDLDSL
jgi:hypothetical protein